MTRNLVTFILFARLLSWSRSMPAIGQDAAPTLDQQLLTAAGNSDAATAAQLIDKGRASTPG